MCTTCSRSGKIGSMKLSSSDDTIATFGCVAPSVIIVGSGVDGVATFTSYTNYNVIYVPS